MVAEPTMALERNNPILLSELFLLGMEGGVDCKGSARWIQGRAH